MGVFDDKETSSVDMIERMQSRAVQAKGKRRLLAEFGVEAEPQFSLPAPRAVQAESVDTGPRTLEKSMVEALDSNEVSRLAFEQNPDLTSYGSVYVAKPRLMPEWLLKRVSHTDDLVASIIRTRANQIRSFGVPRPDRHTVGYIIEPEEGVIDDLDDEAKAALDKRIERAVKLLQTCGSNVGVPVNKQLTFADFLDICTQSAVVVGKIAVEKIASNGGQAHSFRPIDAGTIFPAAPQKDSGAQIRKQAVSLLARLQNRKVGDLVESLDLKRFINDEYSWVQVIDGTPRQVFTDDQIVVKNFYPVPDTEMMGHPVTPLDTVISAVTTHINITTHSKVYFQSGRAAKGMLVIQSDDADGETIKYMQTHFQANINNASNAWRMPVFAIGKEDTIDWKPIDQQGQRDAEFQYLGDSVARIILSAFQMSPDELPGWAYLSKGTSAQTLSEGANEYKLEAHRDLGIRPLIRHFEEVVQSQILPIIDDGLNKICRFRMTGLDADSAEKEANRLAEDAPIHMTQNQIHEKVEKEPLSAQLGGDVVLSPSFHSLVLSKYVTVGYVREHLLKIPGAAADPRFDYIPDPSYFSQQQAIQAAQAQQQQAQQMQQQQLAQAQQQAAQQKTTGSDAAPGAERDAKPGQGDTSTRADDLQRSLQDSMDILGKNEDGLVDLNKAEHQMTPGMRRILRHHRDTVRKFIRGFEADSERAKDEIFASVKDLLRDGEE